MHMADALISPAVGGVFWAFTGAGIAYCSRRVKTSDREDIVPMMGVMGAFVFAAQMINFAIPGTGSSGHMGGGLLLAMLLGPHAAFLVMASVLSIQAMFFADGGLLALGCNIFNLGFFPAFVAYPLFRKALDTSLSAVFVLPSAVLGLLLGAITVIAQTMLSGITEIPLGAFALAMLPIHLAIGVIEGIATAAVVRFVRKIHPAKFSPPATSGALAFSILIVALVTGGALSWFASSQPDGLEWSIAKAAQKEEISGYDSATHDALAAVQKTSAFLPDYTFEQSSSEPASPTRWPAIDSGTSLAGVTGGVLTFFVILLFGLALRKSGQPRQA